MNMKTIFGITALALSMICLGSSEMHSVGHNVTVEGYVMDQYCLDLGVLMDKPDIVSLVGADQHCKYTPWLQIQLHES
jgi:hypothetical protein